MKKLAIAVGLGAAASLFIHAQPARAGFLDDLACDGFKVSQTITYLSFVGAIDGLAQAGAVSSEAECERMANAEGNDVAQLLSSFLPQTLVRCVCSGASYPPPPHQVGLIQDPPYDSNEPLDNVAIGLWAGHTCAANERVTGLSRHPGGPAHDVLCLRGSSNDFSGASTGTLLPGDQRITRPVNGGFDWAVGFFKFQCGTNEYVSGAADFESSIGLGNRLDLVSCAVSPQGLTNVCQVRTFDAHDDRATGGVGDWDGGSYKGECGFDQYMAGISVDTTNYEPHSILCCNVH